MAEEAQNQETQEEIAIDYSFYADIESFNGVLGELAKVSGNFHLFQVVENWCDFKYSEIAEAGLSDSLRELLFQTFIENYSSLQDKSFLLSTAQAAFYMNVFADWGEFVPWLFQLDAPIVLYFLLALGRKINMKDPSFRDQKNAIKEFLNSSGFVQQMLEYLIPQIQSSPVVATCVFSILAAFSKWIDTSFVYDQSFLPTLQEQVSNADAYQFILEIAENTITHAPQEVQLQLFKEMLPLDFLAQTALSLESAQPQISFADYVYFMTLYFYDIEEERNSNVEYAISKISEFPQAGILFLKVAVQAASTPELSEQMFTIAWSVLTGLTSADDASIENIFLLQTNANYALHVLANASEKNPDATIPILQEIFSNIDPLNDTRTAIAQIMFYHSIVQMKKTCYTALSTLSEQIYQGFWQILSADVESIAGDPHATLFYYFLMVLSNIETVKFLSIGSQYVEHLLTFMTSSGASEEVLAVFDKKLPTTLNTFTKSIQLSSELIVSLLDTFTNDRLNSIAILINKIPNKEEASELIQQIVTAIQGFEAEPHTIAAAILSFVICLIDSQAQQYSTELFPLYSAITDTTTELLDNDEVAANYIRVYHRLHPLTEEDNFYTQFENFLGIANGILSITSILKIMCNDLKDSFSTVNEIFIHYLEPIMEKLLFISNLGLYQLVDADRFLVCFEAFSTIYKSILNPQKKKAPIRQPGGLSFGGLGGLKLGGGLGQLKMDMTPMLQPEMQAEETEPTITLTPEQNVSIQQQLMPYLYHFYSVPKMFDRLQQICLASTITTGANIAECIDACFSFVFSPEYDPNELPYYALFTTIFAQLRRLHPESEAFQQGIAHFCEITNIESPEFFQQFLERKINNNQTTEFTAEFRKEVWRKIKRA